MKAIWSGSLSWGLVNIPIKLYSAVESTRADFRMLCREHHAPIRYQRVCEEGCEVVQWNNIVSRLELNRTEYCIFFLVHLLALNGVLAYLIRPMDEILKVKQHHHARRPPGHLNHTS